MTPRIQPVDSLVRSVRGSCNDPLERLAEAVRVSEEMAAAGDAVVDHFVEEARQARNSWVEIGEVLGMTKQAAQQRFRTRWFERLTRTRKSPNSICFTDRARAAVAAAKREARSFNHNYIGTEHLLLGLFDDLNSVAAKALASFGLAASDIRAMTKDEIGVGEEPVRASPPFTPRAKKALDLAVREGRQLGHNYVGTEHILLSLSALDEGLAARFLSASGARYEDIRSVVVSLLTNQRAS
jgi:hypothetical protein